MYAMSGKPSGITNERQDFFDNSSAILGLEKLPHLTPAKLADVAMGRRRIDGKGRAIVTLPAPEFAGAYDDIDSDPDAWEESKSIDAIIAELEAAADPEAGGTYDGVEECMRHNLPAGTKRSSSSGRRRRKKSGGSTDGVSTSSPLFNERAESERIHREAQESAKSKGGRPKMDPSKRRVNMTVAVDPETAEYLRKNKNRKIGRFVDATVRVLKREQL